MAIGGIGPLFVGSPSQVADRLSHWIDVTGIDGFNLIGLASAALESTQVGAVKLATAVTLAPRAVDDPILQQVVGQISNAFAAETSVLAAADALARQPCPRARQHLGLAQPRQL